MSKKSDFHQLPHTPSHTNNNNNNNANNNNTNNDSNGVFFKSYNMSCLNDWTNNPYETMFIWFVIFVCFLSFLIVILFNDKD